MQRVFHDERTHSLGMAGRELVGIDTAQRMAEQHRLLHAQVPLLVRRLVTLIPALVILVIGVDPTSALVISQVVLSFGIPFALIPLVRYTSRRSLLGDATNRWWTTALAVVAAALLVGLNATLIALLVAG